ncbi:winged helix-turn-helix transcriptional regulator [Nonomuraea jiangxiensis]|uniref:DNA-binding transcriptional regulator, HxlR family n=1 Tax=Nonomuraea jiangxiensis TaxID=633440 RepID=A0A1G9P3T8_9ACTN|nr:helix-turn-helix domain-containing protein [Nonomuraea jiangxiensis]SDL93203.1 DNA-binding transcriptional regulator, HxlR family [Nonomuraea jiangxiensis]
MQSTYDEGMLPRTYEGQVCSIARTLEVVGERWSLLIMRDALRGTRRFEDFRAALGIAHNILSDRLGKLCEAGILERCLYQTRPDRYEYRVTSAGLDLWPVIMSLLLWGDQHRAPDGPPLLVLHRGCGGPLQPGLTCGRCGKPLGPLDCDMEPGPGAQPAGASVSPASPA